VSAKQRLVIVLFPLLVRSGFAPRHLRRWAFRGLPNVIDLILLIFKLFHFTQTLNVILAALKLKRF